MTTVLVANRGEIALRIFRTAGRMGLRTVAVYSDADAASPHVRAADVAVRIGPAPATESYLRRDVILEAAGRTGADLIHPGYGFLAEDARFAEDCERRGIAFVGPPSHVLRVVGDKASARSLAERAGVPVFPGYAGADASDDRLHDEAAGVGFPLIVKPSAGGGGKGMTIVRGPDDLAEALASARRMSKAAFDDDRLILERYVRDPRHVEVQIVADGLGSAIGLGERDCTLQRRHQKIWEESPAPGLDAGVRDRLHAAAIAFAEHAGYVGAGTCEFLVAPEGGAGFIEMNARLQVEHPVTELVTGIDLVELQLLVAMGERLTLGRDDVRTSGHAIEVRVYAEDPSAGFVPQAGRVEHLRWPDGVRVDAGIEEGTEVTTDYDPLLAKIVVGSTDRQGALEALRRALDGTELLGVASNLAFLRALASNDAVRDWSVTTDWVERSFEMAGADVAPQRALMAAAAAQAAELLAGRERSDPWTALAGWRPGEGVSTTVVLRDGPDEHALTVVGEGPFVIRPLPPLGAAAGLSPLPARGPSSIRIERAPGRRRWSFPDDGTQAAAVRRGDRWFVWAEGVAAELGIGPAPRDASAGPGHLDSPLPGRVIEVRVQPGATVRAGDELVVIEAMKMEHAIAAPADGTVRAVLCSKGDQVERGQALVDFDDG